MSFASRTVLRPVLLFQSSLSMLGAAALACDLKGLPWSAAHEVKPEIRER
jgi:hypothetical protein